MSHSRAIEVPHVPASGYALSIPPVAAPVTPDARGPGPERTQPRHAAEVARPDAGTAAIACRAPPPDIQAALRSLRYVHFARFLPSPDCTQLMTITTYDGGLSSYTMDFVAVLGDVFTAVLRFIRDAPPLPVQRHPREFLAFVRTHNVPIGVWSAYPDLTVLEIQRAAAR